VRLVADGTQRQDAPHRLAKEEAARLSGLSDSSIFHDDLAPIWQPFLFHDFVSLAQCHGLQYLAEATYSDMQAAGIRGEGALLLQSLPATDRIRYEQYLDFFKMRRFRQTLLCRTDVSLRTGPEIADMNRFHYSAPMRGIQPESAEVPGDAKSWRNESNAVTATTNDPLGLEVLAAIADAWPATKSFADMAPDPGDCESLCQVLHAYFSSGLISAHATPRSAARAPGDRPQVWSVSRLESTFTSSIPNRHLGVIELNDQSLRSLLPLFDGIRTRTELEGAVGGHDALEAILRDMARKALLTS
jgi:hypothetical protein